MRKSNIDNESLRNRNFVLACVASFLLYASVYAVVLPLMRSGLAGDIGHYFVLGSIAVGPFHAWLADKFRRKHVWVYPFIGVLLVSVAYAYATTPHQFSALALAQGVCFGLATSAGITVSIDVVHTGHRTEANMVYTFVGRLGMTVGAMVGLWLMPISTYHWFVPVAAGCLGVLAASWIYVPFRAPIGLPVVSTDRYVLGRAVLPACNVLLLAFACGLLALSMPGGATSLFLLAALAPWLVRMFVKLSHHCQRATGNMTFNLFLDAGLLYGAMTGVGLAGRGMFPGWVALSLAALSVLMFVGITRVYYRKKRVR